MPAGAAPFEAALLPFLMEHVQLSRTEYADALLREVELWPAVDKALFDSFVAEKVVSLPHKTDEGVDKLVGVLQDQINNHRKTVCVEGKDGEHQLSGPAKLLANIVAFRQRLKNEQWLKVRSRAAAPHF